MTRIFMIAAGVRGPWTEGRKNFVRDTVARMLERGLEVDMVTGAGAGDAAPRTPLRCLAATVMEVVWERRYERPSEAFIFPYGRFDGLRGLLNRWSTRLIIWVLRTRGITATVVLYSCAGAELNDIPDLLGANQVKAVGMGSSRVRAMRLGREPPFPEWARVTGNLPEKLLFLSGYQGVSRGELLAVLDERGLSDLLKVGDRLAKTGYQLTIAMPMLKDAAQRGRLRAIVDATCPAMEVVFEGDVNWRTIFSTHDVFVFPYRSSHGCFVPTSVLEAMLIGIPVVISDLEMFDMLVRPPGEERVTSFEAGSPNDLVRALDDLRDHWQGAIKRAATARDSVRGTWTIDRSLDDLLS